MVFRRVCSDYGGRSSVRCLGRTDRTVVSRIDVETDVKSIHHLQPAAPDTPERAECGDGLVGEATAPIRGAHVRTGAPRSRWIGIVPAAGEGSRLTLGGYPKELMPIVFRHDGEGRVVPQLAIERCIESLIAAAIDLIVVVVNDRKLDILRQLGDGARYGRPIVYIQQPRPLGLADAIARSVAPFPDCDALLALPDTIFVPGDAPLRLRELVTGGRADLALAVFPTGTPNLLAPVIHRGGRVQAVMEKPVEAPVANTWGLAAWTARFTSALPELIAEVSGDAPSISPVFARALERGFMVAAADFPEGSYFDLGTPGGLAEAFHSSGGTPPWIDERVA